MTLLNVHVCRTRLVLLWHICSSLATLTHGVTWSSASSPTLADHTDDGKTNQWPSWPHILHVTTGQCSTYRTILQTKWSSATYTADVVISNLTCRDMQLTKSYGSCSPECHLSVHDSPHGIYCEPHLQMVRGTWHIYRWMRQAPTTMHQLGRHACLAVQDAPSSMSMKGTDIHAVSLTRRKHAHTHDFTCTTFMGDMAALQLFESVIVRALPQLSVNESQHL